MFKNKTSRRFYRFPLNILFARTRLRNEVDCRTVERRAHVIRSTQCFHLVYVPHKNIRYWEQKRTVGTFPTTLNNEISVLIVMHAWTKCFSVDSFVRKKFSVFVTATDGRFIAKLIKKKEIFICKPRTWFSLSAISFCILCAYYYFCFTLQICFILAKNWNCDWRWSDFFDFIFYIFT